MSLSSVFLFCESKNSFIFDRQFARLLQPQNNMHTLIPSHVLAFDCCTQVEDDKFLSVRTVRQMLHNIPSSCITMTIFHIQKLTDGANGSKC